MKTGITIPMTRKILTNTAVLTGAAAIIGASVLFVTESRSEMTEMLYNQTYTDTYEPPRSTQRVEPDNIIASIDTTLPGDNTVSQTSNGFNEPLLDSTNDTPIINLSVNVVQFIPDTNKYADKDAVYSALSSYKDAMVEYLDTYENSKIYIVGCIANIFKTADITDIALSEARAEAVKETFVSLGVDSERLVVIGLGVSDPWHEDEWANGYFDKNIAKNNRRVWIIPDKCNEEIEQVFLAAKTIENAKQ